ncbi:MAG TPA: lysyl oxidase family protein [Gemmatimonadaceae bacterium]|nr:lysyl oxidase family protein [Gemmatimonadaceae bacterium]
MRRAFFTAMFLLVAVSCSDTGGSDSTAPVFGPLMTQNGVDTVGLPDLIVDTKATQNNWLVRVEDLPSNFCSVQEGGVTAGIRTLLRFTVTTPNIGDADVFVGSPLKHMDPNGDGSYSDQDGMFELASCHGHFHFQNYATYRLLDADGKEWKAAKRGFCMLDTDPYNVGTGDGTWNYRSCGSVARDGFQGITDGWADTYVWKLGGQYFVLDGGDGQPVVPPGNYQIQVEVNPAYSAGKRGCPLVTDPATGLCHQFAESNYANNVGTVSITIPDHPGRTGYGPLKNSSTVSASDEIEHRGQ